MTYAPAATTLHAPATIRRIGAADLRRALALGWDDFRAAPTQLMFLCIIYPALGLLAAKVGLGYKVLPLIFPLLSGFALVGPLAAVGIYELSRRRERGMRVSALDVFGVLRSPSLGSLAVMGVLMAAIFAAWILVANAIYGITFGSLPPSSMHGFVHDVLFTRAGWGLILLGNGVGFVFAAVVMTLSVVSLPMLVDHDVGPLVAIQTSVRAVRENPGTMALWGLIVVACLLAGSALLFVGLAVALPVLGHATWHLYRRVVAD